jgi:hypothetical protein
MEESMDEDKRKIVYDDIEDPWEFVIRASERYKKAFRKTAKIGMPPKVDEIIVNTVLGVEEVNEDSAVEEEAGQEQEAEVKKSDK